VGTRRQQQQRLQHGPAGLHCVLLRKQGIRVWLTASLQPALQGLHSAALQTQQQQQQQQQETVVPVAFRWTCRVQGLS
jgi:hypothetical protein